jgi:hypothetical protein
MGSVQHLELHASLVYYAAGQAVQSIDFANNGTLPYAAKAGVARAGSKVINLRGDQGSSGSRSGGGGACLGTGVTATYYNDIVPSEKVASQ